VQAAKSVLGINGDSDFWNRFKADDKTPARHTGARLAHPS
jgi:hypothetical protein